MADPSAPPDPPDPGDTGDDAAPSPGGRPGLLPDLGREVVESRPVLTFERGGATVKREPAPLTVVEAPEPRPAAVTLEAEPAPAGTRSGTFEAGLPPATPPPREPPPRPPAANLPPAPLAIPEPPPGFSSVRRPRVPAPGGFGSERSSAGSRPGTGTGTGAGAMTSPGVAAPAGALAADAEQAPPVAVALIRRGGVAPDEAFIIEVLKAEWPAGLDRRIARFGFAQRTWWDSEEALRAGALDIASRMRHHLGLDPRKTTHHVVYGPGHAKVVVVLLRR